MDSRTYLKPLKYQGRFLKYAVNAYYVDFVNKNGNLRNILIGARTAHSAQTVAEIVDEVYLEDIVLGGKMNGEFAKILQGLKKKQEEEVDKFFIILFNQALVMMCTVFDTFLVDCLEVITFNKPETLKILAGEKDITVAEVIDSKTYDDVFLAIQKKIIRRFDFEGVDGKLKVFDRLGLNERTLFTLNAKVTAKFPEPAILLRQIYADRNDIVHRNQMKVSQYAELNRIGDFMGHLIFRWGGIDFAKHFGIPSDLALASRNQLTPPELQTE